MRSTVCPMCKTIMNSNDIFSVTDTQIQDVEMIEKDESIMSEENDKYKNITLLLQNRKPGSKFLVFSNYDTSFVPLYSVLDNMGIKYMYLKGNGNVIKCMIDKYKNNDVDLLLINSRHNGCGLNLENTTDIIMFHKFDTQIEHQVIGRAHRLGRKDSLNIWYFLHANECIADT
jgi:SNF2 family DNA or RNA helicase